MFRLATAVLVVGMIGGLLHSLQRDQALPYLRLAYYPAIEKLVEAGEYREALDQLRIAIDLDFLSRVRIHEEIAAIALKDNAVDDHIRACEDLMDLQVADPMIRVNLTGSLLRRGQPADIRKAETLSRRLLEDFPGQPEVNCNLGAALLAQGKVDEAEFYFRRALEVNPVLGPAQQGLMIIQQERGSDE